MPDTLLEQITLDDVAPYVDDQDPKRKTHIVNPAMNGHIQQGTPMSAQEIVDVARMGGLEVITLCRQKFVPVRNPEKYDACGMCLHIAGELIKQGDGK